MGVWQYDRQAPVWRQTEEFDATWGCAGADSPVLLATLNFDRMRELAASSIHRIDHPWPCRLTHGRMQEWRPAQRNAFIPFFRLLFLKLLRLQYWSDIRARATAGTYISGHNDFWRKGVRFDSLPCVHVVRTGTVSRPARWCTCWAISTCGRPIQAAAPSPPVACGLWPDSHRALQCTSQAAHCAYASSCHNKYPDSQSAWEPYSNRQYCCTGIIILIEETLQQFKQTRAGRIFCLQSHSVTEITYQVGGNFDLPA